MAGDGHWGTGFIGRTNRLQDRIADKVTEKLAVRYTYVAFGFVFFFFGLQKPAPVDSPVRTPVSVFLAELSRMLSWIPGVEVEIPVGLGLNFIGFYEMFMGLLFIFGLLRIAFWLFIAHQTVGFISIIVAWRSVFQPPWLSIGGFEFPWLLGGYSAFVLKNLLFIAAFLFLIHHELGTDSSESSTSEPQSDRDSTDDQ